MSLMHAMTEGAVHPARRTPPNAAVRPLPPAVTAAIGKNPAIHALQRVKHASRSAAAAAVESSPSCDNGSVVPPLSNGPVHQNHKKPSADQTVRKNVVGPALLVHKNSSSSSSRGQGSPQKQHTSHEEEMTRLNTAAPAASPRRGPGRPRKHPLPKTSSQPQRKTQPSQSNRLLQPQDGQQICPPLVISTSTAFTLVNTQGGALSSSSSSLSLDSMVSYATQEEPPPPRRAQLPDVSLSPAQPQHVPSAVTVVVPESRSQSQPHLNAPRGEYSTATAPKSVHVPQNVEATNPQNGSSSALLREDKDGAKPTATRGENSGKQLLVDATSTNATSTAATGPKMDKRQWASLISIHKEFSKPLALRRSMLMSIHKELNSKSARTASNTKAASAAATTAGPRRVSMPTVTGVMTGLKPSARRRDNANRENDSADCGSIDDNETGSTNDDYDAARKRSLRSVPPKNYSGMEEGSGSDDDDNASDLVQVNQWSSLSAAKRNTVKRRQTFSGISRAPEGTITTTNELPAKRKRSEPQLDLTPTKRSLRLSKSPKPSPPMEEPKPPPDAYRLYSQTHRPVVAAENPHMSRVQVMAAVALQWNTLSRNEKQPFVDQAAGAEEEFERQMSAWKSHQKEQLKVEKQNKVVIHRQGGPEAPVPKTTVKQNGPSDNPVIAPDSIPKPRGRPKQNCVWDEALGIWKPATGAEKTRATSAKINSSNTQGDEPKKRKRSKSAPAQQRRMPEHFVGGVLAFATAAPPRESVSQPPPPPHSAKMNLHRKFMALDESAAHNTVPSSGRVARRHLSTSNSALMGHGPTPAPTMTGSSVATNAPAHMNRKPPGSTLPSTISFQKPRTSAGFSVPQRKKPSPVSVSTSSSNESQDKMDSHDIAMPQDFDETLSYDRAGPSLHAVGAATGASQDHRHHGGVAAAGESNRTQQMPHRDRDPSGRRMAVVDKTMAASQALQGGRQEPEGHVVEDMEIATSSTTTVQPMVTGRYAACGRCVGCRTKVNCSSCLQCMLLAEVADGPGAQYIVCMQRVCSAPVVL